jgi:hypothetical protein
MLLPLVVAGSSCPPRQDTIGRHRRRGLIGRAIARCDRARLGFGFGLGLRPRLLGLFGRLAREAGSRRAGCILEGGRHPAEVSEQLSTLLPDGLGVGVEFAHPGLSALARGRNFAFGLLKALCRLCARTGQDVGRLGARGAEELLRLGPNAVGLGARVVDECRRLGLRPGGGLFCFLAGAGGDRLRRLARSLQDAADLLGHPVERMPDCRLGRAPHLKLRDQAIDVSDVGIDRPALVAASRTREGGGADLRRHRRLALALIGLGRLVLDHGCEYDQSRRAPGLGSTHPRSGGFGLPPAQDSLSVSDVERLGRVADAPSLFPAAAATIATSMPGRGERDERLPLERERALMETRELPEPAGAGSASLLAVDVNLALAKRPRARVQGARTPLEDLGLVAFAASTAIHCARIGVLAGDLSTAEQELRLAYAALAGIDETYLLPSIAELLARVVYAQGRLREAEEIGRAAELGASDDRELQALWPSAPGTALAWQERADEAERRARGAVDLIRTRAALSRLAAWCSQNASADSDRSASDRHACQAREPVVTAPGLTRARFLRDILANKKLPDGYARQLALATLDLPERLFATTIIPSNGQPADAGANGQTTVGPDGLTTEETLTPKPADDALA